MYTIYIDYLILYIPHRDGVNQAIWDIQNKMFNITIEGYLQDLLGINIDINHK